MLGYARKGKNCHGYCEILLRDWKTWETVL